MPVAKSRTPRRTQSKLNFGPAKASDAKTPNSKKAPANGNILNFFKKVEIEEQLFLADPTNTIGTTSATALQPKAEDEEDIYGVEQDVQGNNTRYNEDQGVSKRRKLGHGGNETLVKVEDGKELGQVESQKPEPPRRPLGKRSRGKKPFLQDSDSEDDPPADSTMKKTPKDVTPDVPVSNVLFSLETPPPPRLPLDESCPPIPEASIPKHEQSHSEEFKDLEEMEGLFDDDEFDDGEEFRERRFMEQQARLEEEEAGNHTSDGGVLAGPPSNEGMTETCPLCSASLAGITSEQATVHVNACLDGNPIPLPTPSKPPSTDTVDAPGLGKRFAKAATPRPGQANPISLGSTAKETTSAFSKLMSGHAEDAAWASAAASANASRGKPAYQRTCPFYKIMPGFFICVDAFRYGAVKGCNAYFLSHFHSDHYIGLTANWCHGPIYCSKVTGSLIKTRLKTAAKWIKELEFEEKVEVPGTEGVTVTMLPANHCPGSSLFLFEKTTGNGSSQRKQRILHCGDFRACPAQVNHRLLKPETVDAISGKVKQQKIDICYLDTTYLNPRYSFPPQDDVIGACADFCKSLSGDPSVADEAFDALRREKGTTAVSKFFQKESSDLSGGGGDGGGGDGGGAGAAVKLEGDKNRQANPKNRLLVICGTYSIGKERICKAIAQALDTKIFASPSKIRTCAQLGDPELTALMTSDPLEAQVHMQMLMEIRAETLQDYLNGYKPHFTRIVGFRPSGWNFRPNPAAAGASPATVPTTHILHGPAWRPRFGARDFAAQRGSTREAMCFGVPYSEHSSFRELALFLVTLRIERVVPTVNVSSEQGRARMKAWTDRWLSERRRGGVARLLLLPEGEGEGEGGTAAVACTAEKGERGEGGKGKEPVLWEGRDGKGGGVWW